MMRRLAALLPFLTIALLVGAPAAQAIDINPFNDCTVIPAVGTPDAGPANSIDAGPEDPRKGNPFADDPKVSIYEAYGYGGLIWPSSDCAGIDGLDVGGNTAGGLANILLVGLALVVAFSAMILRYAFDPDTLNIFNPIMRLGTEVLGENVYQALFWLTIAVTATLIVVRAARARFAESAHNAGWVVFSGLLGLLALTYPLTLAPTVDKAVTGTVGMINQEMSNAVGTAAATPADGAASNLHHSLLYETWCAGAVGRSAGPTADEFCPRLWAAGTLSRAELAEVRGDEEAMNDLREEKADEFNDVANDLKDADPAAYEYLVGDQNTDRLWYALLGWFAFLCSAPFLVVSGFLLLFALIVLRLAIILLPAVVVVGGFPPMRRYVTGLLDYAGGALLTALLFGSAAAVFIGMIGGFLSPSTDTPLLLAALLLLVTTIAAWKLTKPMRKVQNLAAVRARFGGGQRDGAPARGGDYADDEYGQRPARGPRGGSDGGSGGIFAPAAVVGGAWAANTVPAEAQGPAASAALSGALKGAAATAALTAATGGTATAATLAAGAVKGGAGAAYTQRTRARALAGAPAADTDAHEPPAQDARAATPVGARAPQALPAGAHAHSTDPRAARGAEPRPRVYTPGEATPAESPALVEPTTVAGERVYPIYTPETKGAAT